MKNITDEKSLIKINENSIFYKIKQFFKNLFYRNDSSVTDISVEKPNVILQNKETINTFLDEIRKTENEETELLKLQSKYRNGEIKEEDLTKDQIASLCDLYDMQIARLKKSNEYRKQKLLEYRKMMQTES